jgi:hypothetical protein
MTDLLLINASNFPGQPIYPYGLIQVRALARERGLSARILDLFGVPQAAWGSFLRARLQAEQPRLIGVHLRQADSVVHQQYVRQQGAGYHPVDDAQRLIEELRRQSEAPIAIGGFGYSTHPAQLLRVLRADLGIVGGPDSMLDAFDTVVARGDLSGVANLVLPDGASVHFTPRVYCPPLAAREYDDEVVAELELFYSRSRLYGEDPPTVAVELARGCPFQCYFCTEPKVKGSRAQLRPLEVVMEELRFLRGRGLTRIWLVCSELNLGSAELARDVAQRILAINETPGPQIRWSAYHLPRWLSKGDLELLFRSGFMGGWNDYPSFDDRNLSDTRVPYRSRHALAYLNDLVQLRPSGADGKGARLSLFLGNAYATPDTLRRSLEVFEREGLADRFASASIGSATRAFESDARHPTPPGVEHSRSYGPTGPRAQLQIAYPTFYEAPALRQFFGNTEQLLQFFRYAETSLLSSAHEQQRDWCGLLRELVTPVQLAQALSSSPPLPPMELPPGTAEQVNALLELFELNAVQAAERLYWQPCVDERPRQIVAGLVVHRLTALALASMGPVLEYLGLPPDYEQARAWSTYRLLRSLGARYDSRSELLADVRRRFALAESAPECWALQRLLFERNVVLDAAYNRLLCADLRAPGSLQGTHLQASATELAHA